jgi:hypothetical protein
MNYKISCRCTCKHVLKYSTTHPHFKNGMYPESQESVDQDGQKLFSSGIDVFRNIEKEKLVN